jgi:hypothetical protein
MQIFIPQFQGLGDVKTVGNNYPGVILKNRDNDRSCIEQGINLLPIYHSPDL